MSRTTLVNPYAPSRRQMLVWTYFWALVVVAIAGAAKFASTGAVSGSTAFSGVIVATDFANVAGFYFFLKSRPLFTPILWQFFFAVLAVRLTVAAAAVLPVLIPWRATMQQFVALGSLGAILFGVPLLIGLWLYAFDSPQVWKRQNRTG